MLELKLKDKSYFEKRSIYREYAIKDEISNCLDCLADEIHLYFNELMLGSATSSDIVDNLKLFPMEWLSIKKYLTDGYLAFEIIFNKENKSIGLSELDPITLVPEIKDGMNHWVQYIDNVDEKRILLDSQVVYISYSSISSFESYVESLISSYNKMRLSVDSYIANKIIPKSTRRTFTITESGARKSSSYNLEDVEYFTEMFRRASRVPKSFMAIGDNFDIGDKRWENFAKKHALNLYGIYVKMSGGESKIQLKSLRS